MFNETIIHKNRIRLISLGADPDEVLVKEFTDQKRTDRTFKSVIDITKTSLDLLEDICFESLPAAILVRPNAILPKTPIYNQTPLKFNKKLNELGTWIKPETPTFGWTFPPGWKFPAWIYSAFRGKELEKEKNRGWKFSDISQVGLDILLFEYSGILNKGSDFQLQEGSPIQENIKCYLRYKYGGESGIKNHMDLFLDAYDNKKQEELFLPEEGRYQKYDGNLIRRDRWELPKLPDMEKLNDEMWDSTFMGSCDTKEFANKNIARQTFTATVNGEERRLRKYHEGNVTLKRKKMFIEDDPSPLLTCGAIRSRGELYKTSGERKKRVHKSKTSESNYFTVPPEGTVFFENEDWIPGPEHLQSFIHSLEINDTKYNIENVEAGYWRTTEETTSKGIETIIEFIPAYEWDRHYDNELKKIVPGKKDLMPFEERTFWSYASGGTNIIFHDKDNKVKSFFFKTSKRPDVPLPFKSKKAQYLISEFENFINGNSDIPEREMAKVCFRSQKLGWKLPWSFTRPDGKIVHLGPRPTNFITTDWTILKRSLTSLETTRQLLQEERWEKLAFDPQLPVGEKFLNEQDLYEHDENEAYDRIDSYLDELEDRVNLTSLEDDIKIKFKNMVEDVRDLIEPSITGELGENRYQIKLQDMYPKQDKPEIRRAQADDPFNKILLNTLRSQYANTVKMNLSKGVRDKIISYVNKLLGPTKVKQMMKPISLVRVEKKDKEFNTAAQKIAWIMLLIQSEETPPKKKAAALKWLQHYDEKRTKGVSSSYHGNGQLVAGFKK